MYSSNMRFYFSTSLSKVLCYKNGEGVTENTSIDGVTCGRMTSVREFRGCETVK